MTPFVQGKALTAGVPSVCKMRAGDDAISRRATWIEKDDGVEQRRKSVGKKFAYFRHVTIFNDNITWPLWLLAPELETWKLIENNHHEHCRSTLGKGFLVRHHVLCRPQQGRKRLCLAMAQRCINSICHVQRQTRNWYQTGQGGHRDTGMPVFTSTLKCDEHSSIVSTRTLLRKTFWWAKTMKTINSQVILAGRINLKKIRIQHLFAW